jgi:hypothetical protein
MMLFVESNGTQNYSRIVKFGLFGEKIPMEIACQKDEWDKTTE